MVFSLLEDERVPHRLVLPYPDVRKSLPMHGQTERGMPLRGEWEGVAKPWLLDREKIDCPGQQHLCSTVHAGSTPCPHSAGSYITLKN